MQLGPAVVSALGGVQNEAFVHALTIALRRKRMYYRFMSGNPRGEKT
jgi:hypothetical protein